VALSDAMHSGHGRVQQPRDEPGQRISHPALTPTRPSPTVTMTLPSAVVAARCWLGERSASLAKKEKLFCTFIAITKHHAAWTMMPRFVFCVCGMSGG